MIQKKRIGIFVDDICLPNIRTQLQHFVDNLSNKYSLDLFYHEGASDVLSDQFYHHKVQLSGEERTYKYPISNVLSRIYSFTKAGHTYVNEFSPEALIGFSNPPVMGSVVGLASLGTPTTAIYRYSGDSFMEYQLSQGFPKYLLYAHYNLIGRIPLLTCDKFIVLGPNGRRRLTSRGVDNVLIDMIPPAIDQQEFSPGDTKLDVGLNDPIGIFVGRISRRKGADRLLQIIESLIERDYDINFMILGEGPLEDQFKQFPQDSVALIGEVNHAEISEYYRAADFLVHPSKIEGLPNVLLEAHACGLPSITSPVGEMKYFADYTADGISEYIKLIENVVHNEITKDPNEDKVLKLSQMSSYADIIQ